MIHRTSLSSRIVQCPAYAWSLGLVAANRLVAQDQALLDASWTLTASGQTVNADRDGSFDISNLIAPDLFGPGGPGTIADFLSDDPVRIVGRSISGDHIAYATSEPFQLRDGETYYVPQLVITEAGTLFERLLISAPRTVLAPGDSVQLSVTGRTALGAESDVTARAAYTVYRTSNPAIATVGPDGLVTAVDRGSVYITAGNFGVTTVKRFDVARETLKVRIEGFAFDGEGNPIAGAAASTALGGTAVTGPEGFFSFEVSVLPGAVVTVTLEIDVGGKKLVASTTLPAPAEDSILDFGDVVLAPAARGSLFPEPIILGAENIDTNLAFGDLDGDGAVDVAFAGAKVLRTRLNTGAGEFPSKLDYPLTEQTTSVLLGDVDLDGRIDAVLVLTHYTPQVVADRREAAVYLNRGDGALLDPRYAPLGGINRVSTGPAVLADLNGDGAPDLAAALDSGAPTFPMSIAVLANAGGGAFGAAVYLEAGVPINQQSIQLAAGDLNGDGKADLALILYRANSLSLFPGRGDGSFEPKVDFPVSIQPRTLALADLDGDGRRDVVLGTDPGPAGSASSAIVLYQESAGTFSPESKVAGGVAGRPDWSSVQAADLDGDGRIDLYGGFNSFTGVMSILYNAGGRVFDPPAPLARLAPNLNYSRFSVDLDGDGRHDLVGGMEWSAQYLHAVRNLGGRRWDLIETADVAGIRNPVRLVDVSGDGKLDIATYSAWAAGNGDGTFSAAVPIPNDLASKRIDAFLARDIDVDGRPDLLAAWLEYPVGGPQGNFQVFRQADGTAFTPLPTQLLGTKLAYAAAFADLDQDGDPDLLAGSSPAGFTALENLGAGVYGTPKSFAGQSNITAMALSDLTGDGRPDLALTEGYGNINNRILAVLPASGPFTFGAAAAYTLPASPFSLQIGDLDGNGEDDIAVGYVDKVYDKVSVHYNTGGRFDARVEVSVGINSTLDPAEPLRDLDLDGDLDLVGLTFGAIWILKNAGDGTFEGPFLYQVGDFETGDVDEDGDIDLVAGSGVGIALFRNRTR